MKLEWNFFFVKLASAGEEEHLSQARQQLANSSREQNKTSILKWEPMV